MTSSKITIFAISSLVLITLLSGVGLFINMLTNNPIYNEIMPSNEQKEVTLKEIQKHQSISDCWTYIGGQVFDATNIIDSNPEYSSILEEACGTDGSNTYTVQNNGNQRLSKQQTNQLRNKLGEYPIGLLSP